MSAAITYVGPDEIFELLPPAKAVEAIEAALHNGVNPAEDPPRTMTEVRNGQFLTMPSDIGVSAGVKIATVAPNNPGSGLPRIQGLYVLCDSTTLTPTALLDGPALTTSRTPAVSVAAVKSALTRRTTPVKMVVFGAGPQAVGHAETVTAALAGVRGMAGITYVVRRPLNYSGLITSGVAVVGSDSSESRTAVREADVIVCATTASEPLFDSALIRDDAVVIAVGSHEPGVREIDSALCGRAQVVVEDVDTALRECGDIVMAIDEHAITAEQLLPMRDVVTGQITLADDRPVFFKGSGMSWEDLVVAQAVCDQLSIQRM
ncbi:ornithine cyclodeaminase family protein [Nocardia australiensis]|uniref:ornithine cyclodeaminase family protein n=1 Tax=Nocardia australiensis TaxID=2887191 RepID=UPI001D135B04|nr:ornithine cyclodeaminase family protein [Nocardia australiensis]